MTSNFEVKKEHFKRRAQFNIEVDRVKTITEGLLFIEMNQLIATDYLNAAIEARCGQLALSIIIPWD